MSVHSTHYDDPEEYERDLKYEYRTERTDIPFYTDDPDEEHWRCENCAHCKSFNARKPVVDFIDYVDDKGYVHNNRKHPIWENLHPRWSFDEEYLPANLCELTNNQVMDDDFCPDFKEIES